MRIAVPEVGPRNTDLVGRDRPPDTEPEALTGSIFTVYDELRTEIECLKFDWLQTEIKLLNDELTITERKLQAACDETCVEHRRLLDCLPGGKDKQKGK